MQCSRVQKDRGPVYRRKMLLGIVYFGNSVAAGTSAGYPSRKFSHWAVFSFLTVAGPEDRTSGTSMPLIPTEDNFDNPHLLYLRFRGPGRRSLPGPGSRKSEKVSKKVRKVSKNPFSDFFFDFSGLFRNFFRTFGTRHRETFSRLF